MKLHQVIFCILILLIQIALTNRALAQTRVLDNIDIQKINNIAKITINFNIPLQYLTHEPNSDGNVIVIRMREIRGIQNREQDQDLVRTETLDNKETNEIPLNEIRYEANNGVGPLLTIYFTKSVKFKVRPSPDLRSIDIDIDIPNKLDSQQPVPLKYKTKQESAKGSPLPATGNAYQERRYVINLASTRKRFNINSISSNPVFDKYTLYTSRFVKKDKTIWQRLRLGFFSSSSDAKIALAEFKSLYPNAWVTRVSIDEIKNASTKSSRFTSTKPIKGKRPPAKISDSVKKLNTRPATKLADAKLKSLMDRAAQLIAKKDYSTAIRLYTKVLRQPDSAYHQQAQELLGLARERNGQAAHAISEYNIYLKSYPKGEASDRVRQRLAGLKTSRKSPKARLSKGKRIKSKESNWEYFGSFSQFYRRASSINLNNVETLNQSSLATDLDFSARLRSDSYTVSSRFTGGSLSDFLSNGIGSSNHVSSAYVDANFKDNDLYFRLGRQTLSSSGVLGRFDGGLFSYQANRQLRFNYITGYPINSSRDNIQNDRKFDNVSVDLGTFANKWNFNLFYANQDVDGITDREAVGGEARYFDIKKSLFSLIDYDIHFDELNLFLLIGSYTLPSKTTINATYDLRKSPLLTTTNALQGQIGVDSIDDLKNNFTTDEIDELAKDRTTTSRSFIIGATHPLNKKYQINADITVSDFNGTKASGGVAAIPDTSASYFYNAQLIGSSLFKPGDISILGLRFSDTSTSETTSLNLNTRYPVTREWRINPRLRLDFRRNLNDDSSQVIFAPFLRSEYIWKRRYRFEVEIGGEVSNLRLIDDSSRTSSYYLNIGYRIDF